MKILITGGLGFIGQYTASEAVRRGHTVTALDSLSPQVHDDALEALRRFPGTAVIDDVAQESAWSVFSTHDGIIHLAAETGTAQSMYEKDHYRRVNVEGTRLAARTAANWRVPLVSVSSRAVYGEGDSVIPTSESTPHAPLSEYGVTKSDAEMLAVDVCRGSVPLTIVRPQNVIGFGQALSNPYTGVLSAFLARLKEGKPLTIYGTGEQTRDFVHVSDVAKLLIWALENATAADSPRVLNSGSGERVTLNQLAEYAIHASPRRDTAVTHVDVKRAGDIDHAAADITRLSEVGAPLPQVTTRDAVADFIQKSWKLDGANSSAWDDALEELREKGLTE